MTPNLNRPLTQPDAPLITSDAISRSRTEALLSYEHFESDGGCCLNSRWWRIAS